MARDCCSRCDTPLELGDLRCAICGQSAPDAAAAREKMEVLILRCTGCGAAVAYDTKLSATRCGFCDSTCKQERLLDPMEQSEGYLRFSVSADQAQSALQQWIGGLGWFRPDDLKSTARLESIKPLWWVAWVFDAEAFVSWTADSDAGANRSAWAPHAGQVEMPFESILVSASRGLSQDEASSLTPSYDLRDQQPEPGLEGEAILEQFDLQRSQARRRIVDAIERIAADEVGQRHVPGRSFRNVNVAVVLRKLITRRLSFPAYVLAYRYRNRLYRAVVCGQDAGCVIGTAPYSWIKILLVSLASLLGLAALVLLIIQFIS